MIEVHKMEPVFYKTYYSVKEASEDLGLTYDILAESYKKGIPKKGFLIKKL